MTAKDAKEKTEKVRGLKCTMRAIEASIKKGKLYIRLGENTESFEHISKDISLVDSLKSLGYTVVISPHAVKISWDI